MARLFNPKFAACTSLFFILACSATILAQKSGGGGVAARESTRVRGRQTSQRRPPPAMALASIDPRSTLSLPPIVIYYSRDGAETAARNPPPIEKRTAGIGESITIYYRKPSASEPTRSLPLPKREQLARNATRPAPKPDLAKAATSNVRAVDTSPVAAVTAPPVESRTTAATAAPASSDTRPVPSAEKPVVSETAGAKSAVVEPAEVAAASGATTDKRVEEPKEDTVSANVSAPPVSNPPADPVAASESVTKTAPPPVLNSSNDTKLSRDVAAPTVSNSSVDAKPTTEAAAPPVSNSAVDAKPAPETAVPPAPTSALETKPTTEVNATKLPTETTAPPVLSSPVDTKPATEASAAKLSTETSAPAVSNSPADTKLTTESTGHTAPPSAADTKLATEAAPPSVPSSSTDTVAMNNTAVQLTRERRYDEATDLLRRAIQIEPGTFKFHRNLSIIYEQMNKMDEALVSAETAVKLAPREPTALMQLCEVQLQIKDHSKALGCYENLGKLTTLDSASQTFYGVALLGSGRVLDALDVLEKAAAANPASGVTLNALGFVYFKEKRLAEAISMFKKAVELEPDQEEMRFNLAIAQLAKGNKEGAISQYKILKTANSKLANQLYQILFRDHIVTVDELKR